ncbi:MAG: tetratricopeptide repeat protein, partial [Gemmatimonadaceae bacterium]
SEQRHAEARTLLARILKLDPEFDASHPPSPTDTSDTGDGGPGAVDGSPARSPHTHRAPAALDLVLFDSTGLPAAHSPAPSAAARGGVSGGAPMDAASTLGMEASEGRTDGAPTAAERLADSLQGAAQSLVEMPDGLIRGADFDDADDGSVAPLTALELEPIALQPTALDGGLLDLDAPPLSGLEGNEGFDASDLLDVPAPGSPAGPAAGPPAEPVVLAAAWDADGGVWEIPELSDDDEPAGSSLELSFTDAAVEVSGASAVDADGGGAGALDMLITDDLMTEGPSHGGPRDDADGAGESPRFDPDRDGEAGDPANALVFLSDGVTDIGYGTTEDDAFTLLDATATESTAADDDTSGSVEEPTPESLPHPSPARAEVPHPEPLRPRPAAPAPPPPPATAPLEPAPAGDASFVNLGDWLREDDEPRSTRMITEERAPTGDEDADFAEMLRKFKQGVADNVDENDYASHYDLGIAFREMGLVDEAIAAFQRALRGTVQRVRAFEALGQCFIDKEQFAVAASVLQRALQEPGADDERLVGVLYLLGRAAEAQNQRTDALRYYQRVFAVDIEFGDVADRIGAVERVTL